MHGPYFPKKFDAHIDIYSTFLTHYDSSFYDNSLWSMKVTMDVVLGLTPRGNLSLNSQIISPVEILSNYTFSVESFGKEHYMKKVISDIELEKGKGKWKRASSFLHSSLK